MIGIGEEVSIFLQAVLCGGIVFLAYNCIRIVRRLIRHNLFFISIEDFLFWISTGIYLFTEMYNTSDGSIRWFFVIGVVTGTTGVYGISVLARKGCEKMKKVVDKSRKTR